MIYNLNYHIKTIITKILDMKKFFIIFLLIFTLSSLLINLNSNMQTIEEQPSIIELQMNQDGTIVKNDWIEGLMEFADEDDTLDSLNYVPEFLR